MNLGKAFGCIVQSCSVACLLLFCFLHAHSQSGLNIAKKEGSCIVLVDWSKAADTTKEYQSSDSRLLLIDGYTPYICLKKNEQGYLLKQIYESRYGSDSSVFYLKPKYHSAVKKITWDDYWDKAIEEIRSSDDYKKSRFKLNITYSDSTKYRMLSAPNDSAKPVKCQYFLHYQTCVVVTAIKGDWFEVTVSMFDDCSEWLVAQEKEAHPEKYNQSGKGRKHDEKVYWQIIAEKCFDKGWVRWKDKNQCYLVPLLYGDR
jgi:hypothetical protein